MDSHDANPPEMKSQGQTLSIAPTLETPRLRLIRFTDTDINSQHLQWFHELWTDDAVTAWSLHGKTHTLEESQQWMSEMFSKYDNIMYAIFEKSDSTGNIFEEPGKLVGNVGLRVQDAPTLPPFPPAPSSVSQAGGAGGTTEPTPINLRVIGYAFFTSAWGKGYATESSKAIIDAYAASIAEEKAKGKKRFYLEGSWDVENPASQKVLQKLGFREVGWEVGTEKVFLAGEWRDPGYWVYGMYL